MSVQRLNARKVRKIAEATGLPVVRAWASGGVVYSFAYSDDDWVTHGHGWFNMMSSGWGIDDEPTHLSSCREREWLPGGTGGT